MSEQELMITKFIQEGLKVELSPLNKSDTLGADMPQKAYATKIYEIITDDTVEVLMPMEQGKLILLPVDEEYEAIVYASNNLYQCTVRISDRYKSNNVYILQLELTSNLRKFQRREFFRLGCVVEMGARFLTDEELDEIDKCKRIEEVEFSRDLPYKACLIVDISGGGIRFLSGTKFETGSLLFCGFQLIQAGEKKPYRIVGRVIASREMENRKDTYEHRVQYYQMSSQMREEIIKYIFEEERKSRRK